MSLLLLKPVLWNSAGYTRPAGDKVEKKSYPGIYGYGHEDWNNSPRMAFTDGDGRFRVFHTEPVGKANVDAHAGNIFVFMISSHHGVQQLVGVAGHAMYLGTESYREERRRIVRQLGLEGLWQEIWSLPKVPALYQGNQQALIDHFMADIDWIPNWICPADAYYWLPQPVTLDAGLISGKKRLPSMFGTYMNMDAEQARTIMTSVPPGMRNAVWQRLMAALGGNDAEWQRDEVLDASIATTDRWSNVLTRVGQERFRQALMQRWQGRCAVSGLSCPSLLRASHIKPWRVASHAERLDPENGLLLAAHLDALFDDGMLGFDEEGSMLISSRLPAEEARQLDLPAPLRRAPSQTMRAYLAYHRLQIFKK